MHIETLRQGYAKLIEAKSLFAKAQTEAFTAKDAKAVTSSTRGLNYTDVAVRSVETILNRKENSTVKA